MEQQFIVDENELTEFNVMFRKLEQQAEGACASGTSESDGQRADPKMGN